MKIQKSKLQHKIFIMFSSIICLLILLFSVSCFFYIASSIQSTNQENLLNLTQSTSNELQSIFDDANELSTRLIYSDELKTLFYSDIFQNTTDSLISRYAFNSVFYNVQGPVIPSYQINFIHDTGEFVGFGTIPTVQNISQETLDDISWINDTFDNSGQKFIVPTHINDFLDEPNLVLSLARSFGKDWGSHYDSILEIQIPYDLICDISSIQNSLKQAETSIYIVSTTGDLIYPYDGNISSSHSLIIDTILSSSMEQGNSLSSIYASTKVPYTNWYAIAIQDSSYILQSLFQLSLRILLITLIILLLVLYVSYRLSHIVSLPIKQICSHIRLLSLQTLSDAPSIPITSEVDELDELLQVFTQMCSRLEQSLDETVAARNMEIHSRLLALQSQMDPHFLYNTLTTILILAENDDSETVATACGKLIDMLHYLSSGEKRLVTIQEELQHTNDFISLIQLRFHNKVTYDLLIDDTMLDVHIPRFTIQPLIENCVKYGFTQSPPWHITVNGFMENSNWHIIVKDDGAGFSEKKLKLLKNKILNTNTLTSDLSIEGMGLVSIYIRLQILYGNSVIFSFGNNSDKGSFVEIGGSLNEIFY